MGALLWALLATLTASLAQVLPNENKPQIKNVKTNPQLSVLSNMLSGHSNGNHELAFEGETKTRQNIEQVEVFSSLHQPQVASVDAPARRPVVKREAKKPENTKRRRKFSKKKMMQKQQEQDKSESKTKSEKSKTKSEKSKTKSEKSKTESESSEESEDSETPESDSDSSATYDSSDVDSSHLSDSDSSVTYSEESSDSDSSHTSSGTDESSGKSRSKKKSRKYDSSSGTTEEVSLTSEEDTEEMNSGPDSSPPDSSDSTDESSGSKYITAGSSEISYTMSSSASVYSSSEETSEESESSKSSKEDKDKKRQNDSSKSKEELKSAEPNVITNFKKEKGKKVTEVTIKFDKKDNSKDEPKKEFEMKNAKKNDRGEDLKIKAKSHKETKEVNVVSQSKENKVHMPLHMSATTDRVLQMADHHPATGVKPPQQSGSATEKPKMEMLKVKPADTYSKKKEELKHDLNRDYPENGTVEVVNWEGTFAPIHGEPYVAPLHHQPDSFWDGIYRSTDPDLPTPPGVDVSLPHHTTEPQMRLHDNVDEMVMKTKDKAKKEKKKPKLSPKEKKKKKKEKLEKDNPNNLARSPGRFKLEGITYANNFQVKSQAEGHVISAVMHDPVHMQHQQSARMAGLEGSGGLHARFSPHKPEIHAAGKSEENLKTPSEEERESGTTYKPEGAYEYPSFRHPDFNPDTAYDEHGIPIHESPGWTPPPTLPGDHRFGKERSRPGAGLAGKVQVHEPVPLGKPQLGQPHLLDSHHPQGLTHENLFHKNAEHLQDPHQRIAAQEHQHLAEALNAAHLGPSSSHEKNNKHLIDPLSAGSHNGPMILPAQHQGIPIKDTGIKHRIQKRSAKESSSKEFIEKLKKQEPQKETARDYKAYRLTDSELLEKDKDSPLEALNPALYMHRNMMKARRKRQKRPLNLDKIPDSAEVIAVIVSPQGGRPKVMRNMDLGSLRKIPFSKAPVVYNKDNEARNPLLYKHRNMFKVGDLKDDGLKITSELLKQSALSNNGQGNRNAKSVTMEDILNNRILRGRGRENFNPFFINQRKMFNVRTNKFKPVSEEVYIVKREVKESQNPLLYSYQNIFSSNPKQILPLEKNNQVPQTDVKPPTFEGRLFGGNIPVVDVDSHEKPLDPKVKQYVGKNKEAMNPYLVNYPNMFAVNKKDSFQSKGKNIDGGVKNTKQSNNMVTPNKPLDPSVLKYMGRNKENINPYLYKYSNMFTVDVNRPPKETFGVKKALHKVQLSNAGVNPLLFVQQQVASGPVQSEKVERHQIKKREV